MTWGIPSVAPPGCLRPFNPELYEQDCQRVRTQYLCPTSAGSTPERVGELSFQEVRDLAGGRGPSLIDDQRVAGTGCGSAGRKSS